MTYRIDYLNNEMEERSTYSNEGNLGREIVQIIKQGGQDVRVSTVE